MTCFPYPKVSTGVASGPFCVTPPIISGSTTTVATFPDYTKRSKKPCIR